MPYRYPPEFRRRVLGLSDASPIVAGVKAQLRRLRNVPSKSRANLPPVSPGRWGAVGKSVWFCVRPWTGLAAALGLVLLAVVVLPPLLSPDLNDPKAQFEVLDRARLTVSTIIGGSVLLVGVYINWRRVNAIERQITTLQLGQITERFSRAIDQLGAVRANYEPAPEIRGGGVRSLERVAQESAEDFWPVLDILTSYLRAQWRWEPPDPNKDYPEGYYALPDEIRSRMDVVFALEAIVRLWPSGRETIHTPLNLAYTFVPEISLRKKNLERANLQGANLFLAMLDGANLQGANLGGAFLRRANLTGANLQGADFWGSNLFQARLQGADLKGAFLIGTDFRYARLEGADLRGTNLAHAKLKNACLNGVVYNSGTQWPKGFAPPAAPSDAAD